MRLSVPITNRSRWLEYRAIAVTGDPAEATPPETWNHGPSRCGHSTRWTRSCRRRRSEKIELIGKAGDDADRRIGPAALIAHREPAGPAGTLIPPATVDAVIGAHSEHVEVEGIARDGGDGCAGGRHAARDLEPRAPAGSGIPPCGHDLAIGRRGEEVEMIAIARYDIDRRAGPADEAPDGEPAGPAALPDPTSSCTPDCRCRR